MEAIKLSKYIISKFDDTGDLLTNKKLQKLLYYIESWSLVHLESIVDEDFEAWIHGPVIPLVYHEYKKFSYSPIALLYEKKIDASEYIIQFENEHKSLRKHFELIDNVLNKYGILTSRELEFLSHTESPWLEARGTSKILDNCSTIISKESMRNYYSSLIS